MMILLKVDEEVEVGDEEHDVDDSQTPKMTKMTQTMKRSINHMTNRSEPTITTRSLAIILMNASFLRKINQRKPKRRSILMRKRRLRQHCSWQLKRIMEKSCNKVLPNLIFKMNCGMLV